MLRPKFNAMRTIVLLTILLLLSLHSLAQSDSSSVGDQQYRIILTDDTEIYGLILSQDKREILVRSRDGREFYIPQYEVRKIVLLKQAEFSRSGEYIGEDKFATRYFITTNGLPMRKGEHYVQWNLYGPDFQFALGDRISAGIMTSWLGVPIIGNLKYTLFNENSTQVAVGVLAGTGSWTIPDVGGVLPFATISFGDRSRNLAISGGYGSIWAEGERNGRALLGIAGMLKVAPRLSLVFDSFMLLPGQRETYTNGAAVITSSREEFIGLFIPGLRWHKSPESAFQFGFSGIAVAGELVPAPIPMLQWYRAF